MIRIAHISDTHIDERGHLGDLSHALVSFLAVCKQRDVDLILHSGDFFERRSSPVERIALADFLRAAAELAPVVGVRGNHDVEGDLDLFRRLETRHPLVIATNARASVLTKVREHDIEVYCLPWFDKRHVVARMPAEATRDETAAVTINGALSLLDTLRAAARASVARRRVPVLVTHLMIGGSTVSTGQVLIGQGVEFSPHDLDLGFSYVAVGHIHKRQVWQDGRIAYAGSPIRQNFGEDEPKGFNLVSIENDGTFVSNEFIELPAQRIVLLEDANVWTTAEVLQGARVRLRYHIKPEDVGKMDEEAIRRFVLEERGAADVKIETIVDSQVTARVPEIASATGAWDKMSAWLDATTLDEAHDRERLREKVETLLEAE